MRTFIIATVLLLQLAQLSAQNGLLGRIRIKTQAGSLQVNNGDSSHVYNALLISRELASIISVTVVCKYYNAGTGQWVTEKDTAYSWSGVSGSSHNSLPWAACKPNAAYINLCLGRIGSGIRKRVFFTLSGNNGVFTKAFDF